MIHIMNGQWILTNYDWEIQENERKRLISLLGEEYIPDVLKRIGRLYNGV
jgi:hypothetical protein